MCESKKWTSRNHVIWRTLEIFYKEELQYIQVLFCQLQSLFLVVVVWCHFHPDVNFIFIFPGHWNGNLKRIEILIIVKWLRALFSFIIRKLARIGSSIGYLYFISQSVFRGMLFSIAETNSIRVVCYVITHALNKNTKFCRFSIFLTRLVKLIIRVSQT